MVLTFLVTLQFFYLFLEILIETHVMQTSIFNDMFFFSIVLYLAFLPGKAVFIGYFARLYRVFNNS